MFILDWINSNGISAMLIWSVFLIIAGSVPPLSDNAGFFAKWGYAVLKGISLNSRGLTAAMQNAGMNVKLPEISLEKKGDE
jgi:hypothetical protein